VTDVMSHDRITEVQSRHAYQHILESNSDPSGLLLGIDTARLARQFRGDRVDGNVANQIF
jgi:hypothetical protein